MENNKTHWKTQFKYDYLGSYSLEPGKDIILTVREAKKELITGNNGKKEECLICYFKENVKPMIINKTNCKAISKVLGTPFIEEWKDNQIQIGSAKVDAFGDTIDALRVRLFKPKVNVKPSVETGSTIWNNIVSAMNKGYTVVQVMKSYALTAAQVKELSMIENKAPEK